MREGKKRTYSGKKEDVENWITQPNDRIIADAVLPIPRAAWCQRERAQSTRSLQQSLPGLVARQVVASAHFKGCTRDAFRKECERDRPQVALEVDPLTVEHVPTGNNFSQEGKS